jgi:hypothetical protein
MLAVSWPAVLKVVGAGVPLTRTCAPLMKLAPLTTTDAGPTLKAMGVAEARMGMGFMTAMFCAMATEGLSMLVPVSWTMLLGVGTTAGAV